MRWRDEEYLEDSILTDPLVVERSGPVADHEAEQFEAICRAATAGPLVIDDKSEGGGAVIASLPDGRHVVSQSTEVVGQWDARAAAEANAALICRARCMVLRLLRDRNQWQQREQQLLEQIRLLQAELRAQRKAIRQAQGKRADQLPSRPR